MINDIRIDVLPRFTEKKYISNLIMIMDKNNYPRQKGGLFGYAPIKELRLPKEEYARIIPGIREKAEKLPSTDCFSSYTSFNCKYFFWLNKEENDVIIYRKKEL